MATREVFDPSDPRAPAVAPKSEEDRHRDQVTVGELVDDYRRSERLAPNGDPRPWPLFPLREDAPTWDDVDGR